MFKKLGLAFLSVFLVSTLAYAGGAFQGLPIVGDPGNDICLSFGNNGVCNTFSPAGPPAITGLENVPVNTNAPGGQGFQNVLVPITVLGAGATQLAAPLTGATVAVTAQTSNLVLNPAGTIAALTVTLPAASTLTNGQTLKIGSTQVVTALTLTSGTGTSIVGGATAIAAAGGFELVYIESNATNGTWYRLQ